jgi:hypothetical protein
MPCELGGVGPYTGQMADKDAPSRAEISRVMSLMGRLGGKKGGKKGGTARWVGVTPENRRKVAAAGGTARAKKMTKAQRSESARKAALARWGK